MLGVREMLIVLRARDEASRVIRQTGRTVTGLTDAQKDAAMKNMLLGSSLVSTGTAIAGVGIAGTYMFTRATQAAVEYNRQAALTRTQIDKVGVSVRQVENIGMRVAQAVGAPFEELQASLYDIYSSMDVTVKEGEVLLEGFAKAAVAGQVDIQTAGRATIAILNAWGMEAEDVTRVNDVMFQLVRKGVGTYDEFATAIGRAIPSANRAGQSVEELAGMMAFLTRNGLSTSMAATSAARALDAFSHPETVKKFKDLGISVKNAAGEFRPMSDIMEELGKKMDGLTRPERAKALYELFKSSGGTIQARRFFDQAILGFDDLNKRVDEMKDSGGVMRKEFERMSKAPAVQAQLLSNRWKVLQQQIGRELIPALLFLVDAIGEVVKWFQSLSPEVRKWIVVGLAVAAVLMVIVGVVMVVVGGLLMLSATLALVGISMGTFLLIIAAVVAAIIGIAVAVYFIIKYWDEIKAFTIKVWNTILEYIKSVWQSIWEAIDGPVKFIWNLIVTYYTALWNFWQKVWGAIVIYAKIVWWWITNVIWEALKLIWSVVSGIFKAVWGFIKYIWNNIKGTIFAVMGIIKELIRIGVQLWYAIIREKVRNIWEIIKFIWNAIKTATKFAWDLIKQYVIQPMQALWEWLSPKIRAFWEGVIKPIWDKIKDYTREAWSFVKEHIIDPLKNAYDGVVEWLDKIKGYFEDFWAGLQGVLEKIRDGLKMVNPLEHFSPSIVEQTAWGYRDLNKVTKAGLMDLQRTAEHHAKAARQKIQQDVVINTSNLRTPAQHSGMNMAPQNNTKFDQQITIYTEEIDPRQHAADLGWELMSRVR